MIAPGSTRRGRGPSFVRAVDSAAGVSATGRSSAGSAVFKGGSVDPGTEPPAPLKGLSGTAAPHRERRESTEEHRDQQDGHPDAKALAAIAGARVVPGPQVLEGGKQRAAIV